MEFRLNLDWLPQFQSNDVILMAGCGGGYDIYTGLPIYYALKHKYGKQCPQIVLSNLSLSCEILPNVTQIGKACYKIDESSECLGRPAEFQLSSKLDQPVYSFDCTNVSEFVQSYQLLVDQYQVTTILICDGGCDSTFSGQEYELGTPVEDMISLYAFSQINFKHSYLILLGANVDTFCDVRHQDWIANLSKLIDKQALLTTIQLTAEMPEVQSYINLFKQIGSCQSIVNAGILSALEHNYGNYHHPLLDDRCRLGEFQITLETAKYYIFDFNKVVNHIEYLHGIGQCLTDDDVDYYISQYNILFLKTQ